MKGVITGDIIGSTTVKVEQKQLLLNAIRQTANDLQMLSPLRCELFRGDSFQIIVERPEMSLSIAVLMRAGLKRATPINSTSTWDSRIAVGVGSVNYEDDHVTTSDGEAFLYSGHEFDKLYKSTLAIRTHWEDINEEFAVSTPFADDIIRQWTVSQSEAIFLSLGKGMTQKDIAYQTRKTKQNVSKLLATAKESLVSSYLNRFIHVILLKKNSQ